MEVINITGASIEEWIGLLRENFRKNSPELIPLFETYAAEAIYGRSYIADHLEAMDKRKTILEVGAGSFILSCQLIREGFCVTSLEPVAAGFSHFNRMKELVLTLAEQIHCMPEVLVIPAEQLSAVEDFDFAFSINVMEHVESIEQSLQRVCKSLKVGGVYKFCCPNYDFPYEPHFNIFTLFSKRMTFKLKAKAILESSVVSDPVNTWASLNWINVRTLKKILREIPDVSYSLNAKILQKLVERISIDPIFASRRSWWMRTLLKGIIKTRLQSVLGFVPVYFQPSIDCRINKI